VIHLDLFSGIGGFALAASRVWPNHEVVGFCEIDPFCKKVLKKHWPSIPIHDDIRTLECKRFQSIDIITGGFPCTQTSVAAAIHGKRSGLNGKDSGLWYEYLRVVQEIRPVWVIIENPSGIKKWESEIQDSLARIGYRISRLEVKAVHCGLPHGRRRYLYVANRDGKGLEITRKAGSPTVGWITRLAATGGGWISSTPGTCGGFNGVPDRVDRIKALGNAIVPQVAEQIFEAIKQIEKGENNG